MSQSPPRPTGVLPALVAVAIALAVALGGPLAGAARASGNASAAAGFIESAQNNDGGFGAKQRGGSDPEASLWATVALLAAGKNPGDEWIKGGSSATDYLVAHRSSYTSLQDLGLLALVQASGEIPAVELGSPATRLAGELSPGAVRRDNGGAALGILGLLADGSGPARQTATAAAQTLLAAALPDHGWGTARLSDSASTALVLQALAASGVANATNPTVAAAVGYLRAAQANDGSILASIRTDQGSGSGQVDATAFTIQALDALGLPTIRTPTGTTLLKGLVQYQQQTSGGLTSDGALYSNVPPSVTQTAQAFPAFDGVTFPLAAVARATSGPPRKSKAAKPSKGASDHVSSGTATTGVSGTATTTAPDAGAYKQSRAGTTTAKAKAPSGAKGAGAGKRNATARARARSRAATKTAGAQPAGGGTAVSGSVVGATQPPRLTTRAGQSPGGLTSKQKATITLAAALLAAMLLGGVLDARRPGHDTRSPLARALAGGAALLTLAGRRRAFVPVAVLLIGGALLAVPFATHMFGRADHGARMVTAFKPYMTPQRLAGYQQDVRDLNGGFVEAATQAPKLLFPKLPAAEAQRRFAAASPMFTQFDAQWRPANARLSHLIETIAANRDGYDAVAALPRFTRFPWFFVIPGAVLMLLALVALAWPRAWRPLRWAVLALGIGLVLAPSAFAMWSRAPRGAEMVSAFRTVETRAAVTRVQNDFGQIALGDSALEGELLPALARRGMSTKQIDAALPAVATFNRRWVRILQQLTPVLGVMSDNVTNYWAVAALPSFRAFPWLFAIPGALVALLVLLSVLRDRVALVRRRRPRVGDTPEEPTAATEPAPEQLVAAEPVALAPEAPRPRAAKSGVA